MKDDYYDSMSLDRSLEKVSWLRETRYKNGLGQQKCNLNLPSFLYGGEIRIPDTQSGDALEMKPQLFHT